jgi:hypothetical protein
MELEEHVNKISERIKGQNIQKYDKIELVVNDGEHAYRVTGYLFDLPGRGFLNGEEFEGPAVRYSRTLSIPATIGRKLNQRRIFGPIECCPLVFLDDVIRL